jgi:hypothetical protein
MSNSISQKPAERLAAVPCSPRRRWSWADLELAIEFARISRQNCTNIVAYVAHKVIEAELPEL